MAMGECSVYSSLQADSKVKFAAWPTSWRPPGADWLWPRGTTVDDSTINIVVVIIINIIIILSLTYRYFVLLCLREPCYIDVFDLYFVLG